MQHLKKPNTLWGGAWLILLVFGRQFRSPLPEGALLEDSPVCNRAGSGTPGCLDHLLQLATSKTSRCSGGVANRTTELWGTEAVQNEKQKDEPGLQMQGFPLSPGPTAGFF